MNKERLAFVCNACKKLAEVNPINKKGFEIVAFDNILDWSDFTQDGPELDNKYWERTSRIPQKGELKKVQVHFPFNMIVGEKFWTLFMPGLSHLNGWNEFPEEIDSSAFIKCRFENIISKNEEKAWIEIEIEDVLMLVDICNIILPKEEIECLSDFKLFGTPYITEYKDWILVQASAQGDLGIWTLIKKHKNNKSSVVLYGEWEFHSDFVYCGNISISENELKKLINSCLEV